MTQSPIKEYKFGQKGDYIKAAIWENTSEKGTTYHSATISHHYRDNDGWHETQTLYTHHLPLQALASQKAFEFIHERNAELNENANKQTQEKEEGQARQPAKKQTRRKTHTQQVEESRDKGSARTK